MSFFFFYFNNLLCGARWQSAVAKNRSGGYYPAVHVVNAPPTLPKHEAKEVQVLKKREGLIIERRERT